MANTKSVQGEFPDLDSLIDRELIFKWLYWGLFWLMFTPSVGVAMSTLFNNPDYLGTSEYLTFGRLRPMHVNGVIFGAFSTLFIGLCYYLVPRLTGVRIWNGSGVTGWCGCGTWGLSAEWCRSCSATIRGWKRVNFRF